MANTEGLSDEALSSLLSLPSPEEEQKQRTIRPRQNAAKTPRFPRRALARREQMMELGEGETPAATVVRSSKAPKIRSASSAVSKKTREQAGAEERDNPKTPDEIPAEATTSHGDETETPSNGDPTPNKTKQKPVMLTTCIRERPVVDANTMGNNSSMPAVGTAKKESRFKQRNRVNKGLGSPTQGGFPSLDIAPVGAFTRKGRSARVHDSPKALGKIEGSLEQSTHAPIPNRPPQTLNAEKDVGIASTSLLANMSLEEIRDSVDEVKSILSAESIEFLRRRGRQKQAKSRETAAKQRTIPNKQFTSQNTDTALPKDEQIQLEEKRAYEGKEKMAELLSSVRTPEDMDRVYKEALQLGLAAELPTSSLEAIEGQQFGADGTNERMKNLHTATSLLRSTSPRQRLLGARSLCDILEEDVNEMSQKRQAHLFSDSFDERKSMKNLYPQFLPVAVRCLLDESIATFQTPGGRMLLSIVLRCIHALMTLFVHPYHVVNVSQAPQSCADPFVLYQTCFMSEISHVPPGTELYPPTQIKPIGEGDTKSASCYRADSSAATAESDSKMFYNDPAWTLLSRMRILPCLSDILRCLSADFSTGAVISEATIESICGILAMLSVRSPGAAGAIACHKGILPFLVSYCLSPSNGVVLKNIDGSGSKEGSNDSAGLFRTGAALPVLILLCNLARQSRDIAELEMPFHTTIPHLQAVLCLGAENDEELAIQIWTLALLRILMRYGLAVEHVQSLINIAAPCIEPMKPDNTLGVHYLQLFANICAASKVMHQEVDRTNMPPIPEAVDSLAMAGVWLSSSVRSCVVSFQSVVNGCDKNHMKLASAQLRLLASYISTARPTMGESSIPIISKDDCIQVIATALQSNLLESALKIALRATFSAHWDTLRQPQTHSMEEEAISCSLVASFMSFVQIVGEEDLDDALARIVFNKIIDSLDQVIKCSPPPTTSSGANIHPARQSWFIESEFSILKVLCEERSEEDLLSSFAFSLIGRLNVGHEAMAAYMFNQNQLFQVRNGADKVNTSNQSLQSLFLTELSLDDDRKLQLNHSFNIFSAHGGSHTGSLSSLRCTADFVGKSNSVGRERLVLPLGGIWIYNVLSSALISQPDRTPDALSGDGQHDKMLIDLVSHTLCLILQLETLSTVSLYRSGISDGSKLYHITNVCLLPEEILSNDIIISSLELLYKHFCGFGRVGVTALSLVKDYIMASFQHSRLSRDSMTQKDEEDESTKMQLDGLLNGGQSSPDGYSKDELKALDDFVDDLCNSYIEYGGQYPTFTNFIRLFVRHDFPVKTTTTLLTKLQPILHVLTIEEEENESLIFSLTQSISGGLPSLDSSRRDPSSILDSFAFSLKKKDKELSRNDYVYLLAVAVLSRNLASSSQRCECGLQAMKNRLSGVGSAVFNDIAEVSKNFLRGGLGTKDSLVTCVIDACMNNSKDSSSGGKSATWDEVVASLRSIT